jgi:pyruvate/2-oxoglutarate dehydrogenase complex dihydrolipoamide acyltransferase (E2) component
MPRVTRLTKNRETIYDFLARAKRFHATATSVHELDVTALLEAVAARRAAGDPASFLAAFVKATGMVLARYPRLNRHLFHALGTKYEVAWDEIVCTLVVLRKDAGELILLPANLARPDARSVAEIEGEIRRLRRTPLAELEEFQGMQRLKRLPRAAMRGFSYLCRSHHGFYRRFFGTYGVSPLLQENDGGVIDSGIGVPTSVNANTCVVFLPASVADRPRVVDGQVVPRKVLTMMLGLDHFLVDGHDGFLAVRFLEKLLAEPARLGL